MVTWKWLCNHCNDRAGTEEEYLHLVQPGQDQDCNSATKAL